MRKGHIKDTLKESYTKIDFIFALLGFAGTLILIKLGFIFGN
jgi:hypothetical protein